MIQLEKNYSSGPIADTDLHAGGVFICIIYRRILTFLPDGVVKLTGEILDRARAMDNLDAEKIASQVQMGSFGVNDRGYIQCEFDDVTLTGLPSASNPAMLAFHGYNRRTQHTWGAVYTLHLGDRGSE